MREVNRVNIFVGMFTFPNISLLLFRVFNRNFIIFKKNLLDSFFYFCIEPIALYLVIGFGLNQFIAEINNQLYFEFLIPGYLCFVAFNASFLNASFGTLLKQKNKDVYSALKLSPINFEDMAMGEILSSAFKGMLVAFSVYFVYMILSQSIQLNDLSILFVVLIVAWVGACMGLITATFKRQENLVMKIYCFYILPTSLIYNVFFPVDSLPNMLKWLGLLSPVSHAASINHFISTGVKNYTLYLHSAILFTLVILLTNLAVQRFKAKG